MAWVYVFTGQYFQGSMSVLSLTVSFFSSRQAGIHDGGSGPGGDRGCRTCSVPHGGASAGLSS